MSQFATLLKRFLKRKKISILELSRLCNFDRGSLNQILNGKRSLNNDEVLDKIIKILNLSPNDVDALKEAYKISQIGEDTYAQYKVIQEFLLSLNDIYQIPNDKSIDFFISAKASSNIASGSETVRRLVLHVFSDALNHNEKIRMILQPNCHFLFDIFPSLTLDETSSVIEHIICYDNTESSDFAQNIMYTKCVFKCCAASMNYHPYYYSGRTYERFDGMSLFPFLIISDSHAILLSSDYQQAICLSTAKELALLQHYFDEILKSCHEVASTSINLVSALSTEINNFYNYSANCDLSLSITFCFTPLLSEHVVRTYLNPQIPNFEEACTVIKKHSASLRTMFHNSPFRVICDYNGVKDFFETGSIREYPPGFLRENLDINARQSIIRNLFVAIQEGWYEVILLRPNAQILDNNWTMCAKSGNIQFLSMYNNYYLQFTLDEPATATAITKFLTYLTTSEHCFSKEETLTQLHKWAAEYCNMS